MAVGQKEKPQGPQVAGSIFPFTKTFFQVPGILTHCQVFSLGCLDIQSDIVMYVLVCLRELVVYVVSRLFCFPGKSDLRSDRGFSNNKFFEKQKGCGSKKPKVPHWLLGLIVSYYEAFGGVH